MPKDLPVEVVYFYLPPSKYKHGFIRPVYGAHTSNTPNELLDKLKDAGITHKFQHAAFNQIRSPFPEKSWMEVEVPDMETAKVAAEVVES